MKFYEVHQFSNYPQRNPHVDKLIKEFDFSKNAVEFSSSYNSEKITTASGDIKYFPSKTRTFNGRYVDYKYLHNGNDCYYVEEVAQLPKRNVWI